LDHCQHHEGHVQKMAIAETKIDGAEKDIKVLFDKSDEQMRLLHSIELCAKKNAATMTAGFTRMEEIFEALSVTSQQRVAYGDSLIKEFREEMAKVDKRLRATEEFQWFRVKITWVRDNLPWFVLYGILAGFVALLMFHSVSDGFMRLFGGLIGIKK